MSKYTLQSMTQSVFKIWRKKLANQSPYVKAALLAMDDLRWGIKLRAGRIETDSGTTHATLSLEESVRYIEEAFFDYKHYGGLASIRGVVAEVGPGDNAGVALLMRQDGCDQADLIDRYFCLRDPAKQNLIYEALSKRHQLDWLKCGSAWNHQALLGIVQIFGQPAEVFFLNCARNGRPVYDLIVSRAVMQHLYDPLSALESMVSCLKPGGRMLHKIDLRDLGLFTPQHHPLTFLRFPRSIYQLMVRNSGRPNRVLFHSYRDQLERLKERGLIEYVVFITRLAGVGNLIPHQLSGDIPGDAWRKAEVFVDNERRHFAKEFSRVNSRDLAVAGMFLVVTRT